MDLTELKSLVGDGRIFCAEFIRRTDGRVRKMVARTGVKADGVGPSSYNPDQHGLLLVYDLQSRVFRTIPADSVLRVRANGKLTTTELAKGRRPG